MKFCQNAFFSFAMMAWAGCQFGAAQSAPAPESSVLKNLGIQFDYNHLMGDKDRPMISPSDLMPQSSQEGAFMGLGLSYGFQWGAADEFLHWACVPVVGIRWGSENDNAFEDSITTRSESELLNASLSRKTKTQEIFLSIPVRYYLGQHGQLGDGVYLEGGVVGASSKQTVDLQIEGTTKGSSASQSFSDSISYTKTRVGFTAGLGLSIPVKTHGLDLGLQFLSLPSSGPLPSRSLRFYFQWYF